MNTITITKKTFLIVGIILMLIFVVLITLVLSNNSNQQSTNSLKSSTSNLQSANSELKSTNIVIPEGYPKILIKKPNNSNISTNWLYTKEMGNTIFDKTTQKIIREGNPNSKLYFSNNYILEINLSTDFTKISQPISVEIKNKGTFSEETIYSKRITTETGIRNLGRNIIWYYSPVEENKTNTERGVYIYTKNESNSEGTFIKDLEKNLDFQIYDKTCNWISFFNDEFICQTKLNQLVLLKSNQTIGKMGEIVEVIEDNNNNIYYCNDNNQIFKSSLSNISKATKVFELPKNTPINKISFTAQNEILLNIDLRQSPEYKLQQAEFLKKGYNSSKESQSIPTAKTLELKPDGSTIHRTEFSDFVVLY